MYSKIINRLIVSVVFISILAFFLAALSRSAEAKYAASPATKEMSKDIKEAQIFVQEYEEKLNAAKSKASIYRTTICNTEKEACTKEFLDPLNTGVDLSLYLPQESR